MTEIDGQIGIADVELANFLYVTSHSRTSGSGIALFTVS